MFLREATMKQAFQYSSRASSEVSEICKPLNEIGISFFRFVRVYEDCSYLSLINGYDKFLQNYFEKVEDLGHILGPNTRYARKHSKPYYLFWPKTIPDNEINMRIFFKHGICNGVSLIYRYKNFLEIISYALKRNYDYTNANNFFINNSDLLEKLQLISKKRPHI